MTWDPSKHPRKPAGSPDGGQWADAEEAAFAAKMRQTFTNPFVTERQVQRSVEAAVKERRETLASRKDYHDSLEKSGFVRPRMGGDPSKTNPVPGDRNFGTPFSASQVPQKQFERQAAALARNEAFSKAPSFGDIKNRAAARPDLYASKAEKRAIATDARVRAIDQEQINFARTTGSALNRFAAASRVAGLTGQSKPPRPYVPRKKGP